MHKVHTTTLDLCGYQPESNAHCPVGFFTVKNLIFAVISVMRGLLQLSFELGRSFCINYCARWLGTKHFVDNFRLYAHAQKIYNANKRAKI